MHLKINGEHPYFWQWDLNRQLIVDDEVCGEVHFCNGTGDSALVRKIFQSDGVRLVNVPNILLQTDKPVCCYLYVRNEDESLTRCKQTFKVLPRSKPDDYVYTESEVLTWTALDERIKALEENDAIPVPRYATKGQIIVVSEVDEKGKPIAWRPVRNVGNEGDGVAAEVFNIDNVALGAYSHAEGYGTVAQDDYSHTQGKCNALDPETKYAHVVGNGSSKAARSNAHTIEWDGTAWYAGDVYVGGTKRSEGERLAKVSEIPEIPKDMFTATASEGQLFRVKSVDENGKPTELEPFDLFNAPEAVEIVPGVTLPLNDDGGAVFTEEVPALTLGATYLVMLNGEQYICVAKPVEMDGQTLGLGLGNIGGFTGGENTGEPFAVVRVADELVAAVGFHAFIWALGVESPITVSIIGIDMKIKDEYLPKSSDSIVLTSPGGHKFKVTVDDDGTIKATQI